MLEVRQKTTGSTVVVHHPEYGTPIILMFYQYSPLSLPH